VDAGNTSSYSGSGNIWNDLSGVGNNLTFSAGTPQWISAGGNASFFFNLGGNNYARTTGNASLIPVGNSAWSVSVWASTGNEGYNPGSSLMGWGESTSMNTTLSGGTRLIFMGGYGQDLPRITGTIGAVFNYVFTNNPSGGSTGKIAYRNGTQQLTGSFSGMSSNAGRITVMANNANTPWNGRMYIVKIWNKVLTSAEVTAEWDLYRGRYGL
jgi:hypothetical protein